MANYSVSVKRSASDLEEQNLMLYRKKTDIRNDLEKEPKDLTNRNMFPSAQIKMRLMSPSTSPATSPTMSNSSSPTPPAVNYNKITGIPCVAAASRYTAPVHIDVGGTIYTSSLETLTKNHFPAKMTMKIENEIEKLTNRVNLLENQNVRFKSLLDSALEITKQTVYKPEIHKDESEFLTQTIKLIENEKSQLQEDLDYFKQSETDGLLIVIKQLEAENIELKKKVDLLLEEAQKTSRDVSKLKLEHSEFKFLLTQPDSNSEWLRNILLLDNTVAENASVSLMEQRYHLQQRIFCLERKKTELLHAIEDITSPQSNSPQPSPNNRKEIERVVFNAIDTVAKREYESLYTKVLELEQERTTLLSELQIVLERSRKQIADEYSNLQKKILEIETEKAELRLTLNSLNSNREDKAEYTMIDEMSDIGSPTNDENEALDKILNAFSNSPSQMNIHEAIRRENSKFRLIRTGIESCTIL